MGSGEEKLFFFYVVDVTKPQIAHSLPNEWRVFKSTWIKWSNWLQMLDIQSRNYTSKKRLWTAHFEWEGKCVVIAIMNYFWGLTGFQCLWASLWIQHDTISFASIFLSLEETHSHNRSINFVLIYHEIRTLLVGREDHIEKKILGRKILKHE